MTKIRARLIAVTQPTIDTNIPTAEALVGYCARVSNPDNQDKHDTAAKLLKYCKDHGHWSVFEMASAVVEVEAPRDITRQLLRHRSFSFQEFSQRYSDEIEVTEREFRKQDLKNRQNSLDELSDTEQEKWQDTVGLAKTWNYGVYRSMIREGIAKECARVILPEGLTMSRLYVNGTLRSWMHYLDVRDDPGVTQAEHVVLARKIRDCLAPAFPTLIKKDE